MPDVTRLTRSIAARARDEASPESEGDGDAGG
jgi:hypothetical protein